MCCYFPLPWMSKKHLHWVMQEWDETSQQANCFDEIFKPQIELIKILKESQLRLEILVDIELSSPSITNTISFPQTITIGSIILPCINKTCKYHFNVCIGTQSVGTLSSYLWRYKTTSSANITSMNHMNAMHMSSAFIPLRVWSRICHTRVSGHQDPGANIITRCAGTKSHTYDESWHRIECHNFTI
jgi:hypothetical protein